MPYLKLQLLTLFFSHIILTLVLLIRSFFKYYEKDLSAEEEETGASSRFFGQNEKAGWKKSACFSQK